MALSGNGYTLVDQEDVVGRMHCQLIRERLQTVTHLPSFIRSWLKSDPTEHSNMRMIHIDYTPFLTWAPKLC